MSARIACNAILGVEGFILIKAEMPRVKSAFVKGWITVLDGATFLGTTKGFPSTTYDYVAIACACRYNCFQRRGLFQHYKSGFIVGL